MASGITASRLAIGAALEAAGLRVVYDPGAAQPPCVLVAPTDPWLTPHFLSMRARSIRWRVVAVAGKVDAAVTVEELETLVAAVSLAVLPPGCDMPLFDPPGKVDLAGADYLAAVGRVTHVTEV